MKPLRRLFLHPFQETGRGEEPRPDFICKSVGQVVPDGLMRKNASLKKLLPLFRLCRHFPEFREAGQGIFLLHGRFSLDQGKNVINERLFHAIAAGVEPFAGNKFSTLATSPRPINLVLQE